MNVFISILIISFFNLNEVVSQSVENSHSRQLLMIIIEVMELQEVHSLEFAATAFELSASFRLELS